MIGLVCALCSGLSVGRTSPFVHISCIFANILMYLPGFHKHKQNKRIRDQILLAAAAAGVAASFGTPYGGVLFAIELSCPFFQPSNISRTYLCSISFFLIFDLLNIFSLIFYLTCVLVYFFIDSLQGHHPFLKTTFNKYTINWSLLISFF